MGKATAKITLDPRPPVVMPDSEKILPEVPKKQRKPRKPKQDKPVKDNKRDKPKQLKAKRVNYNTPYCFDESMLDNTGKFFLDAEHYSWIDILSDGYRINIQFGDNVYARYTTKQMQLHFVYWMAYDWLLKTKLPEFETMVKMNSFVQMDYKSKISDLGIVETDATMA